MPLDSLDFPHSPSEVPSINKESKVARVLRRAAQIIRERGWCQKRMRFPDGRLCWAGAIYDAAKELEIPAYQVANKLGGEARWSEMIYWNDAPERTASEVISALESAASRQELGE